MHTETSEFEEEFSKEEKNEVRKILNALNQKISTLELPPSTIEVICNRLDNLSKKVDNSKKFDWKALFIGTIASLIMTLSIPPEASGLIWQYVKTAFTELKIDKQNIQLESKISDSQSTSQSK